MIASELDRLRAQAARAGVVTDAYELACERLGLQPGYFCWGFGEKWPPRAVFGKSTRAEGARDSLERAIGLEGHTPSRFIGRYDGHAQVCSIWLVDRRGAQLVRRWRGELARMIKRGKRTSYDTRGRSVRGVDPVFAPPEGRWGK